MSKQYFLYWPVDQSETGPASLSDGKKAMAEGIAIKVKEEFQKDRVRLLGRYGIGKCRVLFGAHVFQ